MAGCRGPRQKTLGNAEERGVRPMAKRKRTVGLIAFLKGSTDPAAGMPGCANFDHHYGGCLLADTCKVQDGKRCGYFERAVLPTAEEIGLTDVVYSAYEAHVGIAGNGLLNRGQIRRCPDCGDEVGPRQRYCANCSSRRRRQSYRRARQNQRPKRNS
jgi:hypothetical protein